MVVGGNQSGKGAKGLLMGKAAAPVIDDKKDKKKPTSRSSRAGLQVRRGFVFFFVFSFLSTFVLGIVSFRCFLQLQSMCL